MEQQLGDHRVETHGEGVPWQRRWCSRRCITAPVGQPRRPRTKLICKSRPKCHFQTGSTSQGITTRHPGTERTVQHALLFLHLEWLQCQIRTTTGVSLQPTAGDVVSALECHLELLLARSVGGRSIMARGVTTPAPRLMLESWTMAGQPLSQPAPVLDLGTHDDLCLTLLLDSYGIPGGLITKPQRARRPLSPALLKLSLRVFPPNCSSIPLPHDEQVGDEHCRKSPTRGTRI